MTGDQEDVYCEGCGERVTLTKQDGHPTVLREADFMSSPGRVTMRHGDGETAHQCADGTFLPRGQVAPHGVG